MMFHVYTVSVIILSAFSECLSVTIHHPKVVYIRKQGYDYGGEVNHFKPVQLEYKGYFGPTAQQKPAFQDFHHYQFPAFPQKQQSFNDLYQNQANFEYNKFKQEEPLALFVSKPEEQNVIKGEQLDAQNHWESFKIDNINGQLKQDFQPVLQKPPQSVPQDVAGYTHQPPTTTGQGKLPQYPPVQDYFPGLKQPQAPVNLYVGFDNFKNNAIQQPAEAAKQNFNAFNLPKLQQPQPCIVQQQQKGEALPVVSHFNGFNFAKFPPCLSEPQKGAAAITIPPVTFGGHIIDAPKQNIQPLQQHDFGNNNEDFKQIFEQISNDVGNQEQQQGNQGDFKHLFDQIPNNDIGAGQEIQHQGQQGFSNEFKKPNEQNIIKFSNEDAVEPQEVGKVQFAKGVNDFGFAGNINQGKRENGKKRRPKRVRAPPQPAYTYIIRARRHRD